MDTIRSTTRFWQDALTRLYLGGKHQERLEYAQNALRHVSHCFDMAPPQTLGELCLELAGGHILEHHTWVTPDGMGVIDGQYFYPERAEKMHSIRRIMYHRHTDPQRERLYRLKDLIANA